MDFTWLFDRLLFFTALLGLPTLAVVLYFVLLSHHAARLQERYEGLHAARERWRKKQELKQEYYRLADPLFHFRVAEKRPQDSGDTTRTYTRTVDRKTRHTRIAQAVATGRFVLNATPLSELKPGMVLGAEVPVREGSRLDPGTTLTDETIQQLKQAAVAKVPILFNPITQT
ncbi:MAG: hypothetical protein IT463_10870 [Planctomycetes bacterium]|nr:hypothetical protein [Planctomycetota bacterium]